MNLTPGSVVVIVSVVSLLAACFAVFFLWLMSPVMSILRSIKELPPYQIKNLIKSAFSFREDGEIELTEELVPVLVGLIRLYGSNESLYLFDMKSIRESKYRFPLYEEMMRKRIRSLKICGRNDLYNWNLKNFDSLVESQLNHRENAELRRELCTLLCKEVTDRVNSLLTQIGFEPNNLDFEEAVLRVSKQIKVDLDAVDRLEAAIGHKKTLVTLKEAADETLRIQPA